MKLFFKVLLLAVLLILGVSCGSTIIPSAFVKANGNQWVTSNDFGTKKGKSCRSGIWWVYTIGDGSVGSAAEKAGIKKISVVDFEVVSYFWFYHQTCAVVYGE